MSTRSAELSGPVVLVGRSRELDEFRGALRAVLGGSATVVQVTGEIGIGRTRLLQEFAALAGADGATWLLTRAAPRDEEPFGPLRHAEASRPLPSLTEALAVPSSPSDDFGAVLKALATEARAAPLWLLIDDLHAADEATRALAERLVGAVRHGSLRNAPIGLVLSLVMSADTQALRHSLDLQNGRGLGGWMTLTRFGSIDIRVWLEARFGSAPDEALVHLLEEASGGNPLLLSELTHLLTHSGHLKEAAGRVHLDPGHYEVALPRDLDSLLDDRVRSISHGCRRVLTLAAVLGNEFSTASLADLTGEPASRLGGAIDEAVAAALVERRDGGTVAFKHPIARKLLYASTDAANREDSHLHICEGLIGESGSNADEHCLAITHHLLRAGRRADPAQVLRYAPKAAEIAVRHHSHFLAGRYFEAAARVGEGLPAKQRAELFTRAGEAFQRWSDGVRSNECFHEAVSLYQGCGDLAGYARALAGLLRNLISFGEPTREASPVAAQLQGLLGALPEQHVELRVRVHDALASYYHNVARYDIAEAYAQTAMTIARNSADPSLRCIPVTSLALAQMEQLRLTEAKTTWLEGLSFDRAASALRYEGLHLQRLPVPLFCMGEIQEAARYNQSSYRHNQSIGTTGELCLNLTVDVMIANLRGDFDTAISAGREALRSMAVTRYLWSAASLIAGLAYALVMREQYDEAEGVIAYLATDRVIFEDTAPFRSTAERLRHLVAAYREPLVAHPQKPRPKSDRRGLRGVRIGSLARLCGEAELSLLEFRPERLSGVHDALEFIHRRGVAFGFGWCCSVPRALGASTALRGNLTRATGYFDDASRIAERTLAPLELGRVQLYRGLAWLARGESRVAEHDLADALECFERHDAPPLARLAEEAMSRAAAQPTTN